MIRGAHAAADTADAADAAAVGGEREAEITGATANAIVSRHCHRNSFNS